MRKQTRILTASQKIDHNRRNRKYYSSTRAYQYKKNPILYLYRVAKKRASKFNVPFSIAVEDIPVNTHCPIFGTELSVLTNSMNTGMSLDRIDNDKGYIPGNVAIISRKANRLKADGSVEQFEKIIQYMKDNRID